MYIYLDRESYYIVLIAGVTWTYCILYLVIAYLVTSILLYTSKSSWATQLLTIMIPGSVSVTWWQRCLVRMDEIRLQPLEQFNFAKPDEWPHWN